MERIVATRPNGTTYELATRGRIMGYTSAKQKRDLQGADTVTITITSAEAVTYGIGDTITVFGRKYCLNRMPKITKNSARELTYELEFEGVQYDLLRVTYDLTISTTSNQLQEIQAEQLTGDLRRFATVLISNANRVFPAKWSLGTVPDTASDVTLTFSETDNCLSVLQNLCTEFKVEFSIETVNGVNVISFDEETGSIFPFTFRYGRGNGIYQLSRQNVDSSNIITRLKVYGSTENISRKYRAYRLCLPNKTKAQSYIEDQAAMAQYGVWEACKYFEDIKPTFNGEVTSIDSTDVLKFTDTSMFDLNAVDSEGNTLYLIPGCSAKIHFNTGNLAGYEFDVHIYDHATHTFTLKQFEDENGNLFPSDTSAAFKISVGDEYKIIDVALPQTYVDDAEDDLETKATVYFNQNKQPKVKYSLDIDPVYLARLMSSQGTADVFSPGDWIPIQDTDIGVNKSIRIVSMTRDIFDEYDYDLEISDTQATAIITNIISDIIDINNIIHINNLNNPAKAMANWRSSREVLNMVFDPEGDYYTDKIKPNSIDTLCLAVGAKSMQFGLVETTFSPNYNGNANSIYVHGGTLVHYTINENAATTWNLADGSTTLSSSNTAYYIYAKCSKSSSGGTVIFTTEQYHVDGGLFYYFFIGILNSVDPQLNARSISLMYGFTMINGRHIQTGRISSSGGGSTYFDLDAGEIGGKIIFGNGSSGYNNISDKPDLEQYIKDTDGEIEIWYKNVAPTTNNAPASTWTTVELKKEHIGDLYRYNGSDPKQHEEQNRSQYRWYRWESYNTTQRQGDVDVNVIEYHWIEVSPVPEWFANIVPDSLPAVSQKMFSFITPTPPYSIGDIWLNGGVFMKCLTARTASENFIMSDWDDSGIYDNTQTTIDGGIITSGTVQLAGAGGDVKAGITGNGTNQTSVRMWAGDTFGNRAIAPFRVLQNGRMVATDADIKGKITADEGVFYGSLATPAQTIPDDSNSLTLSFDNGFNFAGKLTNANSKIIYLPRDLQYAGVELSIVNYGFSSNGYYDIRVTNSDGFLYAGKRQHWNSISGIKLYGTGIFKAKAFNIDGSLKWFIDNYLDFNFDTASNYLTNNLPSSILSCVGIYTMTTADSMTTVICTDNNSLIMNHTDTGKWSYTWQRARSQYKQYYIILLNSEYTNRFASTGLILNKYLTGFEICQTALGAFIDLNNDWSFAIFETDVS